MPSPRDWSVWPSNPADRSQDREVVLLLHGIGGNVQDWTDPAANYPYNFNHQSQPANKSYGTHYYPPWDWLPEFGISDKMSVGNWKDFLLSVGHTVIAYSQAGPQDRLDVAVKECEHAV